MKLTPGKVIATNIVVLLLIIGTKIWSYFYIKEISKIPPNIGGGRVSSDFMNLYIHQSNDVLFGVPDLSIYIIVTGFLINLLYLCYYIKKK